MYSLFLKSMALSMLLTTISSFALAEQQIHTDYEQMDTIQAPFEKQEWYQLKGKPKVYTSNGTLVSSDREAIKVTIKPAAVKQKPDDILFDTTVYFDDTTEMVSKPPCTMEKEDEDTYVYTCNVF